MGSGNYLKPDVPLPQIPTAFVYLGCWFLMAGIVYYFLGIETKGKSIEQIDKEFDCHRRPGDRHGSTGIKLDARIRYAELAVYPPAPGRSAPRATSPPKSRI